MLRVDRHYLGPGHLQGALDDRAPGDQGLLVRQRQATARSEGSQRDRQAGEADDPVQHDVGSLGDRRHGALPGQELDTPREHACELIGVSGVSDGDPLGAQFARLLGQETDRRTGAERDHLVAARRGPYNIERLGADRAGATSQADRAWSSHSPI